MKRHVLHALTVVAIAACSPAAAPHPANDLGALSKPASVTARDGGASLLVGGRVLWMFGDTLMTISGADGFSYRSSTAAWGAPGALTLDEALDANGAPFQLLPYTADEAAYNTAHGPTERYALWPGSAIAAPDGSGALIFYQRLKVHPGDLNFEAIDVGLARLPLGSTVATRDPMPLFAAPTPAYALAALIDDAFVYVYACDAVSGQLDSICRVVRAALPDAAVWQAWDGALWNANLSLAQPVLHGPPGDLSVSHNAYVGGFLAVYSGIFSNDLWCRAAPRPEGPWSDPQKLLTGQAPASGNDYNGKEHPELASPDGQTVVISYAHGTGTFLGEVRLARVSLP